jgi:hypothetical protein
MAQASNQAMSGNGGKVQYGATPSDVAHLTKWKRKESNKLADYVSSDTDGATRREAGPDDEEISFTALQPKTQAAEIFKAGQGVDIVLIRDKTVSAVKYTGYVFIESVEENVEVESGKIVSYDVTAKVDGRLTFVPPA